MDQAVSTFKTKTFKKGDEMSKPKGIRYVAGEIKEGIELLYVSEKRIRYVEYPFEWKRMLIQPYCGIGKEFTGIFSKPLVVGAFAYNPGTENFIKNVYGYVGVQVFSREPGFFNENPRVMGKDWVESVETVGERHFKARDDNNGYRLVEAYRALRILDASDSFGSRNLTASLLLSGIGGIDYFKEGIGTCLSKLSVTQLKEILKSFPLNLMEVYGYILEYYGAFPSVSEMDMAIANGYDEVKEYRKRVSISLLDEENNREHNEARRILNRLADNVRAWCC